jgi:hypothetical protein
MGQVKNYDIKTMSKLIATAVATLGLGAVPAGMKRYVTLARVNNVAGQQNVLYIASAANSANTSTVALASATQKYSVQLPADGVDQFPNSVPDPDRPLFSFAASSYVNMKTSKGSARVFMQYYDM